MTIEEAFTDILANWKQFSKEYKDKYKSIKSRYLNKSGKQKDKVSRDKIIEMIEAAEGYRIDVVKTNLEA